MRGLLLLAWLALPAEEASLHSRYRRDLPVSGPGQTCAVLNPLIAAHAKASLADLRLLSADGQREIPYVLTRSGTSATENEAAQVVHVAQQGRGVSFDLQMPPRPYSDVELAMAAKNFVATAVVTGPDAAGGNARSLGTFTLFDLSAEGLSRRTTLHLQELALPVLHIVLSPISGGEAVTPETITGATVPPSRERQTRYSDAVATTSLVTTGSITKARLELPAKVPIERIRFALAPGFTRNFRRTVHILSHAVDQPEGSGEVLTGEIDHVHLVRGGARIEEEQLSVPATLGANLQAEADVEVTIENGTEAPLPLQAVVLEARERELCFESAGAEKLSLVYGDMTMEPAQYDYARKVRMAAHPRVVTFGPEQRNLSYAPHADERPLTKRHPRLVYLGLILAVCVLAVVVLRSARLRL